jgi:hypothetical protein
MTDDIYNLAGALRNIERLRPKPRPPADRQVEAADEASAARFEEIAAAQAERLTATVH